MGMTFKSLTSCRQITAIIHRYVHCKRYQFIGELETELERTYTLLKNLYYAQKNFNKISIKLIIF